MIGATDARQLAEMAGRIAGQLAPELADRAAAADVVVAVELTDHPEAGCTLMLDRTPLEVLPRVSDEVDVRLSLSAETFERLLRAEEPLALAIIRGDVTFTGPVRRFLRVLPIIAKAND